MIDINLAKDEFLKYTNGFDLSNTNIQRKVYHSLRVSEICKKIAVSFSLNDEDVLLAELIGLLHDIGRFEQYTKFKTFSDTNSVDHGMLGEQILKKNDYIRSFIMDSKYDEVIMCAIRNHNRFIIENDLNERELLFTNIVRDADKVDIFYEATEMFWNGKGKEMNECDVSEKVYTEFLNGNLVENSLKQNELDKLIGIISFIYDMNFKESFNIIDENMYLEKIINRFNFKNQITKEKIKRIEEVAKIYIKERLNK